MASMRRTDLSYRVARWLIAVMGERKNNQHGLFVLWKGRSRNQWFGNCNDTPEPIQQAGVAALADATCCVIDHAARRSRSCGDRHGCASDRRLDEKGKEVATLWPIELNCSRGEEHAYDQSAKPRLSRASSIDVHTQVCREQHAENHGGGS